MSEHQTQNYTTQGGNETVIGGKLTFLPGATVEGLEEVLSIPQADELTDSTASTVEALRDDFNALLRALRDANLMVNSVTLV